MISFSEPKSHPEPLFKSLNLLKLNNVIESQMLSFAYQWSCRLLPLPPTISVNIQNLLFMFIPIQRGNLCNRNLYVTSVNTTQYGLHSLKFTGPRFWNSFHTSITNSNSLQIFHKTLKNSILSCYSD